MPYLDKMPVRGQMYSKGRNSATDRPHLCEEPRPFHWSGAWPVMWLTTRGRYGPGTDLMMGCYVFSDPDHNAKLLPAGRKLQPLQECHSCSYFFQLIRRAETFLRPWKTKRVFRSVRRKCSLGKVAETSRNHAQQRMSCSRMSFNKYFSFLNHRPERRETV